jgi:uncharacterized protein (TIGR00251 family)
VDRSAVLDPAAPWARRTEDGWLLTVRVQPGATRSGVVGAYGDALKVRVAAPANDGKANAALVRFLATHLGVPPRDVEITAGHHNRTKVVEVRTGGA